MDRLVAEWAVSYTDMVCSHDLGIGAAFRNVYYLTKSFYSEDMKKEHERLRYIEELKRQGQEKARRNSGEDVSGDDRD